ncbi:hypothetical protein M422DRAFT_276542 [Sphaerobolus stellatus SS14]|uniref:Uncharacterized protein n=1 Tax=Sphaerobolus stellatus (strain SS14) TaxID=990650 RepID=A0A0C9TMB5_SPHS4|nr:hypothetical protein M422DRAFT_276542 [Sphaerobolus stellatus SS14]
MLGCNHMEQGSWTEEFDWSRQEIQGRSSEQPYLVILLLRTPAQPMCLTRRLAAVQARAAATEVPSVNECDPADAHQQVTSQPVQVGHLTKGEILALINSEQEKDLQERRAIARQTKIRQPKHVDEKFSNEVIEACRLHLATLDCKMEPGGSTSVATSDAGSIIVAPTVGGAVTSPITSPSPPTNSTSTAELTTETSNIANILATRSDSPLFLPSLFEDAVPTMSPNISHIANEAHDPTYHATPGAIQTNLDAGPHSGKATISPSCPEGFGRDSIAAADPASQEGFTATHDGDAAIPVKPRGGPRTGGLTKEQLIILRDKNGELEQWVSERALEWSVSTHTIVTNMGLDNRERRAMNFWNIFQSVWWNHAIMEHEAKYADAENTPKMDVESVSEACKQAYEALKPDRDDITEEEVEELQKQRQQIKDQYDQLQEEQEQQYCEGNTAKLMRQARKEFTMRSQWFALRGVLIGGFADSIDYLDPISHTLNFMFAGNDAARRFFDDEDMNMAQIIYDFETFCREGEISYRKERKKDKDARAALRFAMEQKSGDKRKSAISEMLRKIWESGTGRKSPRLRWDEWAEDFVKHHQCLLGLPAEVTWPSGPAPYGSIDRGKAGKALAEALVTDEGQEIRVEEWTEDEVKLGNGAPRQQLKKDLQWLNIPIIVDQEGNALLMTGQIEEQANTRAKFVKGAGGKAGKKAKDEVDEESSGKESVGDESTVTDDGAGTEKVVRLKKKRKGKTAKATASTTKRKLEKGAKEPNAKRMRKMPRSKSVCEDTDNEAHPPGDTTTSSANPTKPRPKPKPVVKRCKDDEHDVNDNDASDDAADSLGFNPAGGGATDVVKEGRVVFDDHMEVAVEAGPFSTGLEAQWVSGAPQGDNYYAVPEGSGASAVRGASPNVAVSYPRAMSRPPSRALSRPPSHALSRPPSRIEAHAVSHPLSHDNGVPVVLNPAPGMVRPRGRSLSVEPQGLLVNVRGNYGALRAPATGRMYPAAPPPPRQHAYQKTVAAPIAAQPIQPQVHVQPQTTQPVYHPTMQVQPGYPQSVPPQAMYQYTDGDVLGGTARRTAAYGMLQPQQPVPVTSLEQGHNVAGEGYYQGEWYRTAGGQTYASDHPSYGHVHRRAYVRVQGEIDNVWQGAPPGRMPPVREEETYAYGYS